MRSSTEPTCDLCGGRPIHTLRAGLPGEGRAGWEFYLCESCEAKLPPEKRREPTAEDEAEREHFLKMSPAEILRFLDGGL
jgi:hypothetical protein